MSPQDFTKIRRPNGFNSGLESAVASRAKAELGLTLPYEPTQVSYEVPEKRATFTPQFIIKGWLVVQTIGRLTPADRQKYRLIKEQHPDLDLRFIFRSAGTHISSKSNTTYGLWATRYGYKWAVQSVPKAWLKEPVNAASKAVVASLSKNTRKKSVKV